MHNKLKIRIDLDGILNIDRRRTKYDNITNQSRQTLILIKKLSKNFTVILTTTQNEILAAKWLADNNADCLIPCLLNKEETFSLYINAKCLNNCKDFEKLYKSIMDFKPVS